ncbi:MAG: AAA family ATPase [Pseudomonadota bacterium]
MREAEFRAWLKQRGVSQNSINTRSYAIRTINKNLSALGWPDSNLDDLVNNGEIEQLRETMKDLRKDAKSGGEKFRILMPESSNPDGRLTSWISWLGQYEQFATGASSRAAPEFESLYRLWDEFLETWPLERLQSMTLGEYSSAGSKDSLTYWLEARLGEMGSIWGGSAFKFGIFSRANTEAKSSNKTHSYDDDYGWSSELGNSADEAFTRVRASILSIVQAARAGNMEAVQAHKSVWQVVAWKLAFHFQDREHPSIVNIFKHDWLVDHLGLTDKKTSRPEIYRLLLSQRESGEGILEFGHRIWTEMESKRQDQNANQVTEGEDVDAPPHIPQNLILHGPPGTGKTYHTAYEAVRLCNGSAPEDRNELMEQYNLLVDQDRIAFVTFHQNFSYEDFVEGLRPSQQDEDGEQIESGFRLAPEAGIFRKIAERAQIFQARQSGGIDLTGRRFFKISLGEAAKPEQAYLFDEAMDGGFIHIGDDGGIDWRQERFVDKQSMIDGYAEAHNGERLHPNSGLIEYPYRLKLRARPRDIVIVTKGNLLFRAIGEIYGEYEQVSRKEDDYTMRRRVRWLWEDRSGVDHSVICRKRFSQVTMYEFSNSDLKLDAIAQLVDEKDEGLEQSGDSLPYVLIIDEINRANVSKVFGELITLVEPDKRLGQANALTVKLPYSKQDFGVPSNLHIIGTMNTADRSIALLDTALRRRFDFKELAPDTSVEAFKSAEGQTGLPLSRILQTINDRIEYLIDRDHRIGHAFFIGCKTRDDVDAVMRDKVIPLVQEYFFEDWSRVQSVLGKGFIGSKQLKAPPGIDGPEQRSYFVQTGNGETGGRFPANAYDLLLREEEDFEALHKDEDI